MQAQVIDDFADQVGDSDFEDLEALLNPKPAPDADREDPEEGEGFDELEELLGEALKEKKVGEAVKAARAKAKGGFGLSAEDQARIAKWELEREWKATANCVFFKRWECRCGFHVTVFEALMLEQQSRTNPCNKRWTQSEIEVAGLPKTSAIRTLQIPMCQRCSTESGYSLNTNLIWGA